MSRARGSTGFGPAPLSWADIEAWSRVTGTPVDPWEARAIRAIDDAIIEATRGDD
jgi:hypothetical protein